MPRRPREQHLAAQGPHLLRSLANDNEHVQKLAAVLLVRLGSDALFVLPALEEELDNNANAVIEYTIRELRQVTATEGQVR